mmetsp:Transcript_27214/g.29325  ORF Transcript_27214/g.29325 Transcript_27214/m.29325 type:complete len:101 (+) Transcript_27214:904-1206(+)
MDPFTESENPISRDIGTMETLIATRSREERDATANIKTIIVLARLLLSTSFWLPSIIIPVLAVSSLSSSSSSKMKDMLNLFNVSATTNTQEQQQEESTVG